MLLLMPNSKCSAVSILHNLDSCLFDLRRTVLQKLLGKKIKRSVCNNWFHKVILICDGSKTYIKQKSERVIRSKQVWAMKWNWSQNVCFFNTTAVLGPDFQTDIKICSRMAKCFHDPLPLPQIESALLLPPLISRWRDDVSGFKLQRWKRTDLHLGCGRNTCFMKHLIISAEDNFSPCFHRISRAGVWARASFDIQYSLTLNERCGSSFIKAFWHKFMLSNPTFWFMKNGCQLIWIWLHNPIHWI